MRFTDDFAGGYVQGSPFGENSPGTVKVRPLFQRQESSTHGQELESYLTFLEASDD